MALPARNVRVKLLPGFILSLLLSGCTGTRSSRRGQDRSPDGGGGRGQGRGQGRRGPDGGGGRFGGGPQRGGSAFFRGPNPNTQFLQALELRNEGNCAATIPLFQPIAQQGPGFENVQYFLGDCLTVVARDDDRLSAELFEGMTWLRRAANAGWPEAQGKLMVIHYTGPLAIRSLTETAFWRELYLANPKRKRVGFVPEPETLLQEISTALSEDQRNAAKAHAAKWQPTPWKPSEPNLEDSSPSNTSEPPEPPY